MAKTKKKNTKTCKNNKKLNPRTNSKTPIYLKYAVKNYIYRADAKDLGIAHITPEPHDVIVVSVNKRSKKCKVKTITSLEENKKGQWEFKNSKLNDVRKGNILLIPQPDINTFHLSGINQNPLTIKTNKMYLTSSYAQFPRRYRHLINKK